jgi:Tfp pilus assembly protein PilV
MLGRYIRNKKGLSLVEVLVASALLILVFTGFINAFYYSVNLKVNSQTRLQALLAAQACIEEIRDSRGDKSSEWSDINELKAWLVDNRNYIINGTGVYKKDKIVITLTSSDTEIPAKLIPLYVEVSYEDQMNKGKQRSVKLMTRLREF